MTEALVYVDADGTSHDLACDGYPLDGLEGRFMPPVSVVERDPALIAGSILEAVRHEAREVDVPVAVTGATASAARAALRTLVAGLDPTRGEGELRSTDPDGVTRILSCRYVGGMEVKEALGRTRGLDSIKGQVQLAVLTFRAFDPYWYASSSTTRLFTTGTAATFFPFFPLSLSSSEVFATASETNSGDVDAWPVWTVTGPGSGIRLLNVTTGDTIDLDTLSLGAGESVTIDTRPGVKTVTDGDGTNQFGSLTRDSSLWPLARGANTIQIEMTGADANSRVDLAYNRRYLTP